MLTRSSSTNRIAKGVRESKFSSVPNGTTSPKQFVKTYKTSDQKLQIFLAEESDLVYKCKVCNHISQNIKEFTLHKSTNCTKSYLKDGVNLCNVIDEAQEDKCDITNNTEDENQKHISVETSINAAQDFICKECNDQYFLDVHNEQKHKFDYMVYPCPECDLFYIIPWGTIRHLLRYHKKSSQYIRDKRIAILKSGTLKSIVESRMKYSNGPIQLTESHDRNNLQRDKCDDKFTAVQLENSNQVKCATRKKSKEASYKAIRTSKGKFSKRAKSQNDTVEINSANGVNEEALQENCSTTSSESNSKTMDTYQFQPRVTSTPRKNFNEPSSSSDSLSELLLEEEDTSINTNFNDTTNRTYVSNRNETYLDDIVQFRHDYEDTWTSYLQSSYQSNKENDHVSNMSVYDNVKIEDTKIINYNDLSTCYTDMAYEMVDSLSRQAEKTTECDINILGPQPLNNNNTSCSSRYSIRPRRNRNEHRRSDFVYEPLVKKRKPKKKNTQ